MVIPKKTLKNWSDLKQEGDIGELAKLINRSEPTVYKIFRDGVARVEDAEKINAFYKARKKRIASIKMEDGD
jgi:hypothetical protein